MGSGVDTLGYLQWFLRLLWAESRRRDRERHTSGVGMPKTAFSGGVGLRAMCLSGSVGWRCLVTEVSKATFGLNQLLAPLARLRDLGDVTK